MASAATQLSLFALLLFIIISSTAVYKLTNAVTSKTVGLRLADSAGCPTRAGWIVHAVVYASIVYAYARANKI
jgi:hypothetical protein